MTQHTPQISVIVPAYNAAGTIGEAVDSVLEQTFADFELVVVDDGSTDDTAEVVAARRDPRVRCLRTDNRGVSRARNHGLAMTTGKLVAFLDADDTWLPRKLELQHAVMTERPSVGLCFTSAEIVDDDLIKIGEDPAVPRDDYCKSLLLTGNIVAGGCSSSIVRRSAIASVGGFDPGLSQCADWDMWLRLSLETEFSPLAEPLVRYRKAPSTMSSNPALLERDTVALLAKFFARPEAAPYRSLRRRAYGHHWMVCSGTYLHAGRFRDSVRCLRRGLVADPRTLRRPLVLPARLATRARSSRTQRVARTSRS